ncbi:cadherin-related family member 5 [Centroberyx affinis]|uniref:cadherin-related family member 5 n=1 Tax=Centroberyx affinis TaxID=166261 RepID=UPI003A5B9449
MICSAPESVNFRENNTLNEVVVNIVVNEGVTLSFKPSPANPDNPFVINGNQLIATEVLDYEFNLLIVVLLVDVNDNPPVFAESQYQLDVPELSPVGTVVGNFPATDLDPTSQLYYRLTSEPEGFTMQGATSPNIVVQTPLDYDRVKNVKLTLYAQDTPHSPPVEPSFTATTTILVTITDIDNRPPWFQPCTMYDVGGALICQGAGYSGSVTLTEQEMDALPLKPGPVYAIDGDSGRDEEITYTFLSGNDAGLFAINADTGNITMLKPADVLGPINLTVLAAQKTNSFQFATTRVTIKVLVKSLNPPKFEKEQYGGFVSEVGVMVLDSNNTTEPLVIQAKDDDFAVTGGVNPDITYKILGSSDFSLIGGYLFMTKDRPLGTVSLQVEAVDTITGELATAGLTVEVTSGLFTTTEAPNTTVIVSTTPIEETTGFPTTNSSMTTEDSISTTNPSLTTKDSISTASTAHPHTEGVIGPVGGYGPEDMAAVGASLAALLLVCLVVIGLLACHIQKSEADWRKISEASVFRSALGQGSGGLKEGVQYSNEGFQNDEDTGSTGSAGPEEENMKLGGEPGPKTRNFALEEAILRSTAPLHALLPDDSSLAGSDKADSEKEVKPILTKERRMEEGYKAVWFKEDIDPDAKEERVIIPDNGERDGEEDEEEEGSSSGREEDEEDGLPKSTPKVFFADGDMDSGLGVKLEDPEEDSEDEEVSTADL